MSASGSSPRPAASLTAEQRQQRKTTALAQVYNAIWNASQFVSLSELERYAVGTVNDIRRDET